MVAADPDASQSIIATLLRFAAAVAIGFGIWLAVVFVWYFVNGTVGNERLLRLLFVIANQLAFLLLSSHRLRWRTTSGEFVKFLALGGLVMLTAVALGLLYDVLLRVTFGAGMPTIGPWGEVRHLPMLPAIAIILFAVLIGPMGDEWFFRAGVFGGWQSVGRGWSGALLSSALFALGRLDAANWVAYFGLGLLLCAAYRWSGSVLAVWVGHALLNAMMFVLLYAGYE